jgi:hypothetical protein
MSAYVRDLARPGRLEEVRTKFKERTAELRAFALAKAQGTHPRHPNAIAELAAAYQAFLHWAVEAGALSETLAREFARRHWTGLLSVLDVQAEAQQESDQGFNFISCLTAALDSTAAYLVDPKTGDVPDGRDLARRCGWYEELKYLGPEDGSIPIWRQGANAKRIGWVTQGKVWLDRDLAFGAAQRVAREQGTNLGERRAVWARLAELGVITTQRRRKTDATVNLTVRRSVEGHMKEVAELAADRLWPAMEAPDCADCAPEAAGAQSGAQ